MELLGPEFRIFPNIDPFVICKVLKNLGEIEIDQR